MKSLSLQMKILVFYSSSTKINHSLRSTSKHLTLKNWLKSLTKLNHLSKIHLKNSQNKPKKKKIWFNRNRLVRIHVMEMRKSKLKISQILLKREDIMVVAMDMGIMENLGIFGITATMVTIEVTEIQIPQVLMNRDISIDSKKCKISWIRR